jgi:EAL domain-containing protein (putative c-di-GMP-specific phosphodiesterase class I)
MEQAISADDIEVVFQPIVSLETKTAFAQEALVRCKAVGLTSPVALFEHAVEHHYTGRLGRLIREKAVPRGSGTPLFVNVHPQELSERWLVRPDDPIFQHDHDVYIEVTESVPMLHYELCFSVIEEIRQRGHIHLVVDDLGAGFSNLKRIVDLKPSVVKLDRELVHAIDGNKRQQKLVRSIVDMCVQQDATVVAEGIETVSELKALIDIGVHYGQGFLLARPAWPIPPVTWPKF